MIAISEDEKLLRRRANESVFGTFAMEGLTPDEPTREIFRKYAEGLLTLDQFSEAMDCHAYSLVAAYTKMAGAA